jgi:hypothetical protein
MDFGDKYSLKFWLINILNITYIVKVFFSYLYVEKNKIKLHKMAEHKRLLSKIYCVSSNMYIHILWDKYYC